MVNTDAQPDGSRPAGARADPGQPGHHRGAAGRQARRLGPGSAALRHHPARGRDSDRFGPRALRRLPGRPGLRLPPLVFSSTEALGLVMAVLDGHHQAGDPADPVGSALGKIIRALPSRWPPRRRRSVVPLHPRPTGPPPARVGHHDRPGGGLRAAPGAPGSTTAPRPVRPGPSRSSPWAVVVRHGRWYLLCRVAHQGGRPGLPGRPGPRRSSCSTTPSRRRPTSTRSACSRSTSRRLGVRRRGRHRRPRRQGQALCPPRPRPARGGRRPTTRLTGAPATRTGTPSSCPHPGAVPRPRRGRAAAHHAGAGATAARRGSQWLVSGAVPEPAHDETGLVDRAADDQHERRDDSPDHAHERGQVALLPRSALRSGEDRHRRTRSHDHEDHAAHGVDTEPPQHGGLPAPRPAGEHDPYDERDEPEILRLHPATPFLSPACP